MAKSTDRAMSPAEELARAYIDALQAKDKARMLSLLADDFTLVVPFNVSGTNDLSDSWCGIAAAGKNYEVAWREIAVLKYTDIVITPGSDPNVAFLEGRGAMTMANGRSYRNLYVFRFEVEGGKIKRAYEYANPVTGAIAFGIPLPQSSSEFLQDFVTAKA